MKKNFFVIAMAFVAMFAVSNRANAQDKVSEATTWDFESYEKGSVISNGINNINGLYVRGSESEGHEVMADMRKRTGKFADGTPWKSRIVAAINGNGSLKKDVTTDRTHWPAQGS